MSTYRIAVRYAKALHDLALEQGKLERILTDVQYFNVLMKDRDFLLFVKSPVIQHQRKSELITSLLKDKFDPLTMAFLRIFFVKGREKLMGDVAREFVTMYKKHHGISTVKLTTAVPLSAGVIDALKDKLQQQGVTGTQIELESTVDANMIGGFILEVGDLVYDASLAHKLENLRRGFIENPYVSQIIAR
jgi:F-type H+-transporting ATPase subunit delta